MSLKNFFRQKKVLVTGGLGFLGSTLAHRLAGLGAKVTLLDSLLKMHGGNTFNLNGILKQARWIKGDIRNAALMKKILKGQDFLFNIAAQTSHTDSMNNPLLDVDINARGQIILLEACRAVNPDIRIVYCSTRAVYGSTSVKSADEQALPNPLDFYSVNKLAGEHYHRIYHTAKGLNTVILRVANSYGPRAQMKQPVFGILNWFIRLAIDDQEIKIFGDGKQVRDYVYVDDIIHAFVKVAHRDRWTGEIFNLGSGRGIPLIEIVKKIVRLTGKGKIVYVPWPKQNLKIDTGDFIANIRKIRKEVQWSPNTPLETGLKKTIGYYKQYKSHYW